MNGGSFSTTCEFLSTLHNHHRATFIGEEAAGGYYGNTSGPSAMLVLPNSRLRLPVRVMTYYMAIEGTEYGNRSIPADYPVSYTIDELVAGKDKEMEKSAPTDFAKVTGAPPGTQFTASPSDFDMTSPTVIVTGWIPWLSPEGTTTFTWYNPENPGASPLKATVAG